MDLDDELRQLFTSDRLDVPVRADADQVILAGARRLRRRRIATATAGGVFAVVAVVIGGIALAGGNPDAMPPATTNPSTPPAASSVEVSTLPSASTAVAPPLGTTSTPTQSSTRPVVPTRTSEPGPPDLNFPELGPTGFQALELGQTVEEAQATGLLGPIVQDGGADGCSIYELLSDDRTSGRVYAYGGALVAIAADPAQTPEGVGPGWTIEQARVEYPDLREGIPGSGAWFTVVPGNASARYALETADGVVTSVTLRAYVDQTCYE